MNQTYEKLHEATSKFQEPFEAIVKLNMTMLQNMNFIKPDELVNLKKPEELMEKHVAIAIENGHKVLDYLQKSFQIMEKATLDLLNTAKTNVSEVK